MKMSDWYILRARLYSAELALEQAKQKLQALSKAQPGGERSSHRLAVKLDALLADIANVSDIVAALSM